MPIFSTLPTRRPLIHFVRALWLRFRLIASIAMLGSLSWAALGQIAPTPVPATPPPATAKSPVPGIVTGPLWADLSASEKKLLAPLAPSWESLDSPRKRKWIAIAQTYPKLPAADQERFQTRIAEWAALSPRERAVARLNFSESKKLPATNRAANWDTYKALPSEDRKKFAAQAATAPKGAALSLKPATPDKVTPVPITRHTPAASRTHANLTIPTIDRKTLLPQALQKSAKPLQAPTLGPAAPPPPEMPASSAAS
jgi:hypothetical protein